MITDAAWRLEREERWHEMPLELREEAVRILTNQEKASESFLEIARLMKEQPLHWITPYHFRWGMGVRNLLRQEGILDHKLPSGNWDDYYVQVIEEAVTRYLASHPTTAPS